MAKRLIGIILGLVLLCVTFIFLFIPKTIDVSKGVTYNVNQAGVFRFLSDPGNWQNWWPWKKADSAFQLNGSVYRLQSVRFNALDVTIEKNGQTDTSEIHMIPIGNDSVKVVWHTTLSASLNPFHRLRQHFKSRELAGDFAALLVAIKKHTSIIQNVYGADIKREKIKKEYMVSIKTSFDRRPTDVEIYSIIKQIRAYIATKQTKEEDHPFFNISQIDNSHFELVVGVPVTTPVPDAGIFLSKKLLRNGNMITADVTGGQHTVDAAMKQFELFIEDHQLQKIALPFQTFLNDRMTTDSSKWITRIAFPIL